MSATRRRNTLLEGLEYIRSSYPLLNLTHIIVLLYIFENEGINIAEVASICGLTRATASRSVRGLAEAIAQGAGEAAIPLLEVIANPDWSNGRLCVLSDQGLALRDALDAIIARCTPIVAPG